MVRDLLLHGAGRVRSMAVSSQLFEVVSTIELKAVLSNEVVSWTTRLLSRRTSE